MNHKDAFEKFLNPPREFGPMPFWFWNDDLEEAELIRQLHAFREAHYGGFVLHARVGLSRRIGYLTDEFFRLARRIVKEAAHSDMKVILYDEGSYPSGSAQGAVVAENADYASQAIGVWEKEIEGPFIGYWRPNTGRALLDRHVCTLIGRVLKNGQIDPGSIRQLEALPNDIFYLEASEGRWKVMSVWNTQSGGHIRGVFPEEESGSMSAPPAGDILNPDAVACFLRLTHDRYYEHLKEFFGSTVIAVFTDEPAVFGKSALRPKNPKPYTPGLVDWLEERWGYDPRPWLPALWLDFGEGTEAFRKKYDRAIQERMHEVFYTAQSQWCADHGIALTGHPGGSNELSALRYFQLPGQDMVWRYVEPDKPTAIEGEHSVAAKAATSGARIHGARRVLTEVCGAYGWKLTLEEVKWLFDWHLVRGNNLMNPHAVFYSIRGRRAWESEPDLCLHNVWRPYVGLVNRYAQRVSGMLCDGMHVCAVAVLGDGDNLPWEAAGQLYRNQIDFLYLDGQAVADATVVEGVLESGTQTYQVIIVDGDPVLSPQASEQLGKFEQGGGLVIEFESGMDLPARLDTVIERDLRLDPRNGELRAIHYRRDGLDTFFIVNEGTAEIRGELCLTAHGKIECWNPLTGERRAMQSRTTGNGLMIDLLLPRRESIVLVVDPDAAFAPTELPAFREESITFDPDWKVCRMDGESIALGAPEDWAQQPGWELFSGTICFKTELVIRDGEGSVMLNLGKVGDIGEVILDGKSFGVRMWAPYEFSLGTSLEEGVHQLEIRVTNSMANAYEGSQIPSGLMGPIELVWRRKPSANQPT
jgi:hypothetical protein